MSRSPTAAEMIEIQAAFEACGFGDVQVVDKLRDVTLDSLEDGNLHFVGTCFAEDSESVGSFRVSFHCLLNPEGKMSSAYAYDVRTGNEIAFTAA
tara:strand:- start:3855 stop:4139 length:285 start_codon:yes stop_codon:yes gene_type:complete